MFRTKTQKTVTTWALGVACLVAPSLAHAADPVKLTGGIAGVVRDYMGAPQMGAAVFLYNHQNRMLERVLTDEHGAFKLLGLLPDLYFVKVMFAAFAPTIRQDIKVQPGMRSILNVRLDTLFSSLQLSYPTVESGPLMSDDWKWVLRSSSATRPVLRLLDPDATDSATGKPTRVAMFSDTRGIVKVSGGEGSSLAEGVASQADMGTAFALATSLYGSSVLQVSGNVGYGASNGVPVAAFRTSYSRNIGLGNPDVSLTMRQLYLPGRLAAAFTGTESAMPAFRSMSASFDDRAQLADNVTLRYGMSMDCVSFLDHLNYYSPYARLTYNPTPDSTVELTYTAGNARPDMAGADAEDEDLQRDLNSLGLFPRVSLLEGRAKIQRGEEYEVTYSHKAGSRTFHVSGYREVVQNLALSLMAPLGYFSASDVMPDLFSNSSIFNVGNFGSTGFTAALTQALGDHVSVTGMYEETGALTVGKEELVSNNPDELRSMIRQGRRQSATMRVVSTIPHSGTHLIASYQWSGDRNWLTAGNLYSTQSFRPLPGMNLYIRQPIPGFGKRVEATADLRNMLAQGYLPLSTAQGQNLLLVQNPRSFRGGLSFIF
ncbi:conserved exported hypothetical protein [Candidatus Sulfopaludibacter sp. SbA3]|nr:conserved exported hypothetical protein [Candidatus Sulfopaludibacter sp. SbA3]